MGDTLVRVRAHGPQAKEEEQCRLLEIFLLQWPEAKIRLRNFESKNSN